MKRAILDIDGTATENRAEDQTVILVILVHRAERSNAERERVDYDPIGNKKIANFMKILLHSSILNEISGPYSLFNVSFVAIDLGLV